MQRLSILTSRHDVNEPSSSDGRFGDLLENFFGLVDH